MLNDRTQDFIVGRLANFTNTAEGSLLPPPQKGQFRVPFVAGLQVLQTQPAFKATTFTLSWQDIVSNVPASQALTVDHYNIYYVIPGDGTRQPIGPYSASKSPVVLTVPFSNRAPVTFIVQTVLTNGMTSELASSPTTTSFTNPTLIQASDINLVEIHNSNGGALQVMVTWSDNSPIGGSIAWSAGSVIYQGISYPIAAGSTGTGNFYVWWTINNPNILQSSVTPPSPFGVGGFIIATNTTNTSGSAGFVSVVNDVGYGPGDTRTTQSCSFFSINTNSNLSASIARSSAAASGILRIADGTGAGSLGAGQKIIATGSDGKIQMATFEVNVANSSGGNTFPSFLNMATASTYTDPGGAILRAPAKTLEITVDGTAYRIPVYPTTILS